MPKTEPAPHFGHPRPFDFMQCRTCNDHGDGGICTCCGELHTVTIVPSCITCHGPVEERVYEQCLDCRSVRGE